MPHFDSLDEERYHDRLFKDESNEHDIWNCTTQVMKLTRGKLQKQDDWDEWKQSEYLHLDQYEQQYMFEKKVKLDSLENVFDLVRTYPEEILDKRRKSKV